MKRAPVVWTALFGVLAFVMIFLARSTMLVAPSLQGSKYTLLVVVQVLLLAAVLLTDPRRMARPSTSTGSAS